ncbi:hypothetical protein L1887_51546 [Cichorium endivia]|nr:hypothetical protein L1887_51546 [Cichorium endivia]
MHPPQPNRTGSQPLPTLGAASRSEPCRGTDVHASLQQPILPSRTSRSSIRRLAFTLSFSASPLPVSPSMSWQPHPLTPTTSHLDSLLLHSKPPFEENPLGKINRKWLPPKRSLKLHTKDCFFKVTVTSPSPDPATTTQ